jgi:fatty-acyl-CoA synthase
MGMSLTWITDSVAGQAPPVSPQNAAIALADQPPLSWAELHALELRYASALLAAGIQKGDRVGMLLKNSTDYIALYLAVARAGAIAVRLNWRLAPAELEFIINDSGAGLLFFDQEYVDGVARIRADLATTTYVVRGGGEAPSWAVPFDTFVDVEAAPVSAFPLTSLDDPVALMYTSGTTGRPKGAIWTHGNDLWFASIQGLRWGYGTDTVALTAGPLFHAGGFEALLLGALCSHGTAVTYSSGGFDLTDYLAVGRERGATDMLLYSFMVPELLRLPHVASLVPSTLRRIVCGGDTLMPWVYEVMEEKLPDVELVQVFGLTEGGAISTCLEGKDRAHAGSVGRPMPMTQVRVVAPDGTDAPAGESGEIWVRSPAVSGGYWNRPEASAETFVDGWCRTGDLGALDADGFLSIGGRAKDMIRTGGENVYPAEVEAVLTTAPGVADAAVVGVPDARWVEVGCAVLVPLAGASIDVEEVRKHCLDRLAKYKVPHHFVVKPDLPRTASGKVKKFELRDQYRAASDHVNA